MTATMTPKPGSGRPSKPGGLRLTFETLALSHAPGARELLMAGLHHKDPLVQHAAASAVLRHEVRDGQRQLLHNFARFEEDVVDEIVRHVDSLSPLMREIFAAASTETRANIVEIVRRAHRVKLAYFLVQALGDPDETIRARALAGLKGLCETYHRQLRRVESGAADLSRVEIETRKYALLDPVLSLLTHAGKNQPDELMTLAMGLDARASNVLATILASAADARSPALGRMLMTCVSPQFVSFVLDCLCDSRVAFRAVAVIQKRRDMPFVANLLRTHRFFTDQRVVEALQQVEMLLFAEEKKRGGSGFGLPKPRQEVFSHAVLALRAIHLLVLTSVPADEKSGLLEAIDGASFPVFVTGLAREVRRMLAFGRSRREISLALAYLESRMGLDVGRRMERRLEEAEDLLALPELGLPWAQPDAQSLPADAFEQFFNAFDGLDEATRRLALEGLRRLDPELMRRVQEELESLDADCRLRAVQVILMLDRPEEATEALVKMSRDPDNRVRATVVKTLGLLENETAVRALLDAVTDLDRRVLANTVEAIEMTRRSELRGLANVFARHPNNRIRANAVKALWTLGDEHADGLLRAMLKSEVEPMRLSAAWVLGEIDHPARVELLRELAANDPSERVRGKAESILGEEVVR